eukprot:TRINITY_DN713_c4_g1_i1.p1 TRINITY_DN713_c4_g1~~TRINITY_DN713_c4_g1_i1.p1  ORF type:complete len:208 (+),score=28.38 TRINITY_DN713_c4_g1_i1:64-687(+)
MCAWAHNHEAHRYASGSDVLMLCASRNNNNYYPLDRKGISVPSGLVEPVPYANQISQPGRRPKDGDWNCKRCLRFNYWDHHKCQNCWAQRPKMEIGRGTLREALETFYTKSVSLKSGYSAADVRELCSVPYIPLVPKTDADVPVEVKQQQQQQQQQQPGNADKYAHYRTQMSQQYHNKKGTYRNARRCFKCGSENHFASDCRTSRVF